ncbi:unnamed protein product [Allacma fusca]|uniref:Uncharacterized protein n=1 Tax=Allacma fusca TaxID=39272 RepID=A0A8J2K2H2_9HEXA|nr:unnamed protein product [Allacma fusca]
MPLPTHFIIKLCAGIKSNSYPPTVWISDHAAVEKLQPPFNQDYLETWLIEEHKYCLNTVGRAPRGVCAEMRSQNCMRDDDDVG